MKGDQRPGRSSKLRSGPLNQAMYSDIKVRLNAVTERERQQLGKQKSDSNMPGVWITDDWEASKLHVKLILANSICVFWVCDPLNKALRSMQQLQVLANLIEYADEIYKTTSSPKYLKGTIDERKTKLWILNCHLMDKKLEWKRVIL